MVPSSDVEGSGKCRLNAGYTEERGNGINKLGEGVFVKVAKITEFSDLTHLIHNYD
jgi:hypothetical protein